MRRVCGSLHDEGKRKRVSSASLHASGNRHPAGLPIDFDGTSWAQWSIVEWFSLPPLHGLVLLSYQSLRVHSDNGTLLLLFASHRRATTLLFFFYDIRSFSLFLFVIYQICHFNLVFLIVRSRRCELAKLRRWLVENCEMIKSIARIIVLRDC